MLTTDDYRTFRTLYLALLTGDESAELPLRDFMIEKGIGSNPDLTISGIRADRNDPAIREMQVQVFTRLLAE